MKIIFLTSLAIIAISIQAADLGKKSLETLATEGK
jgi:maltodextrin utilization protein YvdJ